MGIDCDILVEYQMPDGTWVAVCSKLAPKSDGLSDSDRHFPCTRTTCNSDEPCKIWISLYSTVVKWPEIVRVSPFFALLAPDYESPWGSNTFWELDYPAIETKSFMPERMSARLEYLRKYHGLNRPWVNWVTGKELLEWFEAVKKVEDEDRVREVQEGDFEDAQIYLAPNSNSIVFKPAKAPTSLKLTETHNYKALEQYLPLAQECTGITDPERIRFYFELV